MKIGLPKEIKPQENRIGLTPESVKQLTSNGHEVLVENNGGFEAGFENEHYTSAGAKIVDKAEDIFNDAQIIVKVKEPLSNEVKMIRENQIVFTYLHLAAAKELTEGLVKSKSVCIAYETVTDNNGRLPLLAPMSAVAGRMSVQAGQSNYSEPKDVADHYSEAEVGYPSEEEYLLARYAEDEENLCDTVYGYVPCSVIDEVIEKANQFVVYQRIPNNEGVIDEQIYISTSKLDNKLMKYMQNMEMQTIKDSE